MESSYVGAKFPLSDGTIPSLWENCGLDILGPYKYRISKTTRNTGGVRKVWLLMVTDQTTSMVAFYPMEDYSADSTIKALGMHINQWKCPRVITCDAGSQLRRVARVTRSMSDTNGEEESNSQKSEFLLRSCMKKLKGISWNVAPASGQSRNGLVEGNVRVAKNIMNSFLRKNQFSPSPVFSSLIDLLSLFAVISKTLNTRPIMLYSARLPFVTASDLVMPNPASMTGEPPCAEDINSLKTSDPQSTCPASRALPGNDNGDS